MENNFRKEVLDNIEMELSIVDPDIASNFRRLGPRYWNPGAALNMQIARSLKELVALLRASKEKEKVETSDNCTKDSSNSQDFIEP